jgi:hypothetical protein
MVTFCLLVRINHEGEVVVGGRRSEVGGQRL